MVSCVIKASAGGACTAGTQVYVIVATGHVTSIIGANMSLIGARFLETVASGNPVKVAQ